MPTVLIWSHTPSSFIAASAPPSPRWCQTCPGFGTVRSGSVGLTVKTGKVEDSVLSKLLAAAGAVAALFGLATVAQAGAPVRTPNGKGFLVLQFKVSPPRAGAGVAAEFDSFGGNDVDGQQPPTNDQTRTIAVRLARGSRVNSPAFASCTVADANRNRCSRASVVGTGTA